MRASLSMDRDFKRFPIYTMRTVGVYRTKRRSEVPSHIFAIAEGSYHSM